LRLKTSRLKISFGVFWELLETFQYLTGKRSVLVSGKGLFKPEAMSGTHFV